MPIENPPGNVIIRPASETDAAAYRTLRLEALKTNPEAFSADYATNEKHPLEFWRDRLKSMGEMSITYFATHEKDLVGMCGIGRGNSPKTQHSATIWGVYVQPAWRGRQVASMLFDFCLGWARDHRVTVVKLGVVSTNTAAIRRYASCGFKVYGIEPQAIYHNGRMYDELLMAYTFQ